MKNNLKPTKKNEIKREWHLIDAGEKILGRLTSEITSLLIGKNKPYFVNYLDCGDYVVVVNAAQIKTTGEKEKNKKYTRYSGYPGGLKTITLEKLRVEHPERIIEYAVRNMLPKNKHRDQRMARLKIFAGDQHPYQDKFKKG
ncbi:MAG: 50S ribosomal protein L13 [Microgenomates group bacterium ADurb.Bin219]|nr:MAG: 50S ribosomal protein L13 [Microgenomates group bacterium ADurb.Bin219]HNP89194.1 50S ribosomal protein L13 [Candidatus Woesebacteria bacterium]